MKLQVTHVEIFLNWTIMMVMRVQEFLLYNLFYSPVGVNDIDAFMSCHVIGHTVFCFDWCFPFSFSFLVLSSSVQAI